MRDIYLSVVIPVYNEENRIGPTVEQIIRYFEKFPWRWELICVLDGCSDLSAQVIRDICEQESGRMANCDFLLIENACNFGKGRSVQQGVLAAKGQYVLFTDADLSTPMAELEKFWSFFQQGFNVVIGSRSISGSSILVKQNWIRQTMGKTFNFLVRFLVGLNFKDTQCGFKCFDQKSVRMIFPFLKINGFAFDVELLYLAKCFGLKVKECSVKWINSPLSKVRIFSDSFKMLVALVRVRFLHLKKQR